MKQIRSPARSCWRAAATARSAPLRASCCSSALAPSSTWCRTAVLVRPWTDLAGGLVAGHFATLASGSTLLSGGRIQAVAVASDWRLPAMPQLNALAEQGAKDMVLERWWGPVAPVGTPHAFVASFMPRWATHR